LLLETKQNKIKIKMIENKITKKKINQKCSAENKKEKNTAPSPLIWVSNQSLPSSLL
jgi:hypothetical protein